MLKKVHVGSPKQWSEHVAQMQTFLVGQDVKDASNKVGMIRTMICGKALMDFNQHPAVIHENNKKNAMATKTTDDDDEAAVIVYNPMSIVTNKNLSNCLLAVAKEVFPI